MLFTLHRVMTLANECLSIAGNLSRSESRPSQQEIAPKWHHAPSGKLKCNVDVGFVASRGIGIVVVIIHDENGRLITGCTRNLPVSSSLIAEAIAIRDALIM